MKKEKISKKMVTYICGKIKENIVKLYKNEKVIC